MKKILIFICLAFYFEGFSQLQYAKTEMPIVIEKMRKRDIFSKVKRSIHKEFLPGISSTKLIEQKVFNYLKLHENIDIDTLSNFNLIEHEHWVTTNMKGVLWNDFFVYEYLYNHQFELFQINKIKKLPSGMEEIFNKKINNQSKIEYIENNDGGIWFAIELRTIAGKRNIKTAFYY